MILGIGNDLCSIDRIAGAIERRGRSFLNRVFTPAEQAATERRVQSPSYYAGLFAAKEACVKALGTGITERVRWTDVEVLISQTDEPTMTLSGGALRRLRRLAGRGRATAILVSISQDAEFASALVVLKTR